MPGLDGVTVLVTRPRDQAAGLTARIADAGGRTFGFPALEIVALEDPAPVQAVLARLEDFDLACFVSVNSVNAVLDTGVPGSWPASVEVAAIGLATATRLAERGVQVSHVPQTGYTSEELLALPALSDMKGRKVIVFRGEGGRRLLDQTLRSRGAHVESLACYVRRRPHADPAPLRKALENGTLDAVTVSSGEGLSNLVELAGETRKRLFSLPLFAPGERVAGLARSAGFNGTVQAAASASDADMIEALLGWARDKRH